MSVKVSSWLSRPEQQTFTFRADLPVRSSKAVANAENVLSATRPNPRSRPKLVALSRSATADMNAPGESRIQNNTRLGTVSEGFQLAVPPEQQIFSFRADLPVQSPKAVAKTENALSATNTRPRSRPKPVAPSRPATSDMNAPGVPRV